MIMRYPSFSLLPWANRYGYFYLIRPLIFIRDSTDELYITLLVYAGHELMKCILADGQKTLRGGYRFKILAGSKKLHDEF
jgi:hypothetical protein